MMLSSEVLPAPFGPMIEVKPPRRTDSEMSSTARTPPKCFETPETASSSSLPAGASRPITLPDTMPPAIPSLPAASSMPSDYGRHDADAKPRMQPVQQGFTRRCAGRLRQVSARETIGGAFAGLRRLTRMSAPETLPTTVLTGFLGSGKTTLLRRALVSPALADTAVIINELGEIAIDHHLVDFVEGSVLELPGGCLCCAVREDLARTLRSLLDRREAGEIRRFRRVVIETTGLADPAPILFTLGADPMLDHCLHLARVVTLVDAVNGADSLDRFAEAGRQAALADTLVITKTDLAPLGPDLARRLDALNNRADPVLAPETKDAGLVLFGDGKQSTAPAAPAEPVAVHTHGI